MAQTTIHSDNVVTKFLNELNRTYVRGGRFEAYTGMTESAIIQTKMDLKTVSIPLVGKLSGQGVKGNGTLNGNEESLANYAYTLTPTHYRNAVRITDEENEKSEFDLFREARPTLQDWLLELKRDQIIQAFGAIEAGGVYYNYGDASAANLDTWQAANSDRILYGNALANLTSGDHTTSLSTVDTTNDKLTASTISLLKRMAEAASPLIRPVMVKGDEPWFVYFVDSYGFRDLQVDSTIAQANREARARGLDNPIFTGADLLYDGVIIKKIPDINKFIDGGTSYQAEFNGSWGANATSADGLDNGGNSGSRVGMGFFAGAQAIGFGLGKKASFALSKEDDYGFNRGVAVIAKHDIKKTFYNAKQHGVITHFYSAARDA